MSGEIDGKNIQFGSNIIPESVTSMRTTGDKVLV